MVDPCPFLFEALMQVNNNTFPFQQHLKVACDLLSPLAWVCFFILNNSLDNNQFIFKIPF